MSGALLQSAAPLGKKQLAQNITISAFHTSGSNSRAGFTLQRDGDILRRQGASNVDLGDFVDSGLPDAFVGNSYEVRTIQLAGDTLTVSSGLNVWLQISGNREWAFNDSPGLFKSANGTYEVRNIADPTNTSGTKTWDLETEDGS